MKKTILFVHSAGSQGINQGSDAFVKYLKNECDSNVSFLNPMMPNPNAPKYNEWRDTFESILSTIEDEVILIGHSIGGSFLLKYLSEETLNFPVAAVFIVAAPYWGIDADWQLKDFFLKEDFAKQLSDISKLFLYHSRNEETVPFQHYQKYARKIPQVILREIEGDQHAFDSGLPELVEDINALIN